MVFRATAISAVFAGWSFVVGCAPSGHQRLQPARTASGEPTRIGRVVGQIFREGKPWAFANGLLYGRTPDVPDRRFKTDAEGRYTLEDVPAGPAEIGAEYAGGELLWSDTLWVRVRPGATVQADINHPEHDLVLVPTIGGAATQAAVAPDPVEPALRPIFGFELTPLDADAVTLPRRGIRKTEHGRLRIRDVLAGRYRVRLLDEFGGGEIAQTELQVGPARELPIRMPGGSVAGSIAPPENGPAILDVVLVSANGVCREARSGPWSNYTFVVPYVAPGRYTLLIHEPDSGWDRLENVAVDQTRVDVSLRTLQPGGTITGRLLLDDPDDRVRVQARDSHGIVRDALRGDDLYALANVWPADWTLTVLQGDQVLFERTVTLAGTETVELDLAK